MPGKKIQCSNCPKVMRSDNMKHHENICRGSTSLYNKDLLSSQNIPKIKSSQVVQDTSVGSEEDDSDEDDEEMETSSDSEQTEEEKESETAKDKELRRLLKDASTNINIELPEDEKKQDKILMDVFTKFSSHFDEDDVEMCNDILRLLDALKTRGCVTEDEYRSIKSRLDQQMHLNLNI